MNSYMHNCNIPHSQLNGLLASEDYDEDALSSDLGEIERDIDAEIEAKLQHDRLLTTSSPPPAPRTVSQRMLQSLQNHRDTTSTEPRRRMSSRALARAPGISCDRRSGMNEDTSGRKTERLTDAIDAALSPRSGKSSCTDRLTARITKNVLSSRDSRPESFAGNGGQYVSVFHSDRRTYPAESLRQDELERFSDNTMTPQETTMLEILDMERATRVFRRQMSFSEVSLKMRSLNGVSFHFRRESSMNYEALNRRRDKSVPSNKRADVGVMTSQLNLQSAKRVINPNYTVLTSQLTEIEALLDGIENFTKTPSFTIMATRTLNEMALLSKTTQQIRINATSLILAYVGNRQNADFAQALRRFVARAAFVQQRISALMLAVKKLM